MIHPEAGHSTESASVTSTPIVDGTENEDVRPPSMIVQFPNIPEHLGEDHSVSDSVNEPSAGPCIEGEEDTTSNSVSNLELSSPLLYGNGQQIRSLTQRSVTDNGSVIRDWVGNVAPEKSSSGQIDHQEQSVPPNEHDYYHHPHDNHLASENGSNSNRDSGTESSNESTLVNSRGNIGNDAHQQTTQRNLIPTTGNLEFAGPASPALSATSIDSASTTFYDCEEIPYLYDDDDDLNDCDDKQNTPNDKQNFAPTDPFWLGKGEHERAREHLRALPQKQIGNNGPHGPHCAPYETGPETALVLSKFDEIQAKFYISMLLEKVLVNILIGREHSAETEAREALEIAKKLDQDPTTARCYYWLGLIEYKRGNEERAYTYFLEARPCVDEYRAEGKGLDMYLGLLQRGMSREDRELILLSHGRKEKLTKGSRLTELKRKRNEFAKGEPILRMTTQRLRETKRDYSHKGPRKIENNTTPRPKVWVKHDTEDTESPRPSGKEEAVDDNDDHRHPALGKEVLNADLAWLNKIAYEQDTFDIENHPKGLAPRTRTTKVFVEQPWEVIMPTEKWSSVQETASNKRVTMSFLKTEQEKLNRWSQAKAKSETQDTSVNGAKKREDVSKPTSLDDGGEQQPKNSSDTNIPLASNAQSNEAGLGTTETREDGDPQHQR